MEKPREVDRRVLHKGRKFDLEQVTLATSSGRRMTREVVRHPGAVVVVPVLADGRLVMIRNYRFAVGETLYEFCAGTLEPPEPPAECARRELIEETGYEAAEMEGLGSFYTTSGMTDERMHAFIARRLTEVGQRLEEDEQIEVVLKSPEEALAMVDSGELVDAKSIVALLRAHRLGRLRP
ncbi:MAG: NUDIX hydrolase [Phycisphaeraceae bacterium]|nr:NUDIX hydrolase [Phycisphaeraceae bacterium]